MGEFNIQAKDITFYSGIKGESLKIGDKNIKYFTQISGDYLFYSVPFKEEKVSEGCIRSFLR